MYFWYKIIFIFAVIFGSKLGLIQDQVYSKVTTAGEIHSLGFINGNAAGVVVFSALLDLVILNVHIKKTLGITIGLFVAGFLNYQITYSRTALLMSIAIATIYLFKKKCYYVTWSSGLKGCYATNAYCSC